MKLALTAPCTTADLAEVLGRCHPHVWDAARRQLARSQSFAIRDPRGRALVAGGFWPEPGYREAWFLARARARGAMGAVLRLTRLTLLDLPQCDPRPVIAVIRTVAGARIANLLGFAPLQGAVWQWRGPHDGRRQQAVRHQR